MVSSINLKMDAIGKTYPKTYPLIPPSTGTCIQWRSAGVFKELMRVLHEQVREQVKKKPHWTTLIIIDSQAVKNTCNASVESKGFCFYKATNGIKRHLAIDTLGFPFFTHCTRANVSDDAGLIEMFTLNIDYFQSKPIDIPKITILLDHGYHPEYLTQELERIYPQIMTKIQFQLSTKPSQQEKAAQGKCGESSCNSLSG